MLNPDDSLHKPQTLEEKVYTCLNHGALFALPVTKNEKSYFKCGMIKKYDPIDVKKTCPVYLLTQNRCKYEAK